MTGWLRTAWRGMGPWKWLGVAAIVTVIVLTPATARGDTLGDPQRFASDGTSGNREGLGPPDRHEMSAIVVRRRPLYPGSMAPEPSNIVQDNPQTFQ